LLSLVERCPAIFREGTAKLPAEIDPKRLQMLEDVAHRHPGDPNVLAFVENCFHSITKIPRKNLQGNASTLLNKRDQLLTEILTQKPVNTSVLKLLQEKCFQPLFFPRQQIFQRNDFNKLLLMIDLVKSGNPAHYDFLLSHAHDIKDPKCKAERLEYAFAVAAKRIEYAESYNFSELIKQQPFELAKELINITSPDSSRCALKLADAVINAATKSKREMGAKLLVFLAENADLIEKFEHVMQRPNSTLDGKAILSLLDKNQVRIRLFGDCLRNEDTTPFKVTIANNPILLKLFSIIQCQWLTKILSASNKGDPIPNYTNIDENIVDLAYKIIRRYQESASQVVCHSSDPLDQRYASIGALVIKGLYNSFMTQGVMKTLSECDLSPTTNDERHEKIVKFLRSLLVRELPESSVAPDAQIKDPADDPVMRILDQGELLGDLLSTTTLSKNVELRNCN
jgi:hypothetical protein